MPKIMQDIIGAKEVMIVVADELISNDYVIWVHTPDGTVLRICQVEKVSVSCRETTGITWGWTTPSKNLLKKPQP